MGVKKTEKIKTCPNLLFFSTLSHIIKLQWGQTKQLLYICGYIIEGETMYTIQWGWEVETLPNLRGGQNKKIQITQVYCIQNECTDQTKSTTKKQKLKKVQLGRVISKNMSKIPQIQLNGHILTVFSTFLDPIALFQILFFQCISCDMCGHFEYNESMFYKCPQVPLGAGMSYNRDKNNFGKFEFGEFEVV